jgi:hypothetical protein
VNIGWKKVVWVEPAGASSDSSEGAILWDATIYARYPKAGVGWNDYIKVTDPSKDLAHQPEIPCDMTWNSSVRMRFNADDAANSGKIDRDYRSCLHAGEYRQIEFKGLHSCTGLSATDANNLFDWACEINSMGRAVVYSTRMKNGKGLVDLVDSSGREWKNNWVIVRGANGTGGIVAQSPPAPWWPNPVLPLPTPINSSQEAVLDEPGAVYTARATSGRTMKGYRYMLPKDNTNVSVVTVGDTVLSYGAGTVCEHNGTDGDCTYYMFDFDRSPYTGHSGWASSHVWMEGHYDAGEAYNPMVDPKSKACNIIRADLTTFSRFQNLRLTGNAGCTERYGSFMPYNAFASQFINIHVEGGERGFSVVNATNSLFKDIYVSNVQSGDGGFELGLSSNGNVLNHLRLHNNSWDGLFMYHGMYNVFSDILSTGSIGAGIRIQGESNHNVFVGVTSVMNRSDGVQLAGQDFEHDNLFSKVLIANNAMDQINGIEGGGHSPTWRLGGLHFESGISNEFSDIAVIGNAAGITFNPSTWYDNTAHEWHIRQNSASNSFRNTLLIGENNYGNNGLYPLGHWNCAQFAFDGTNTTSITGGGLGVSASYDCLAGETSSSVNVLPFTGSLANLFVGKVTDRDDNNHQFMSSQTNGTAQYNDFSDNLDRDLAFTSFDNDFRGWSRNYSGFPQNSALTTCRPNDTCRIWDWRLKTVADAPIYHSVNDPSKTDWYFQNNQPCPPRAYDTDTANWGGSTTYLRNAVEVIGTGGNDDGLCETGETCILMPNIGAYQGSGNYNGRRCVYSSSATVANVKLYAYPENGVN